MLAEAGAGLPTGKDGRGSCPAHASISLVRVNQKSLCKIFYPPHEDKRINCWQWPGPTGGKTAFFSTSCSTVGCVAIGHPICIINMTHLTVIISHNYRLYGIPVFIAIIAFSGWIVNVCQEAHVSLIHPHHICQVTPGPYSNATTLQSECVGFRSLGMPFLCSFTVPQQEISFWASRQTGQGRKRSCPRRVYGQIRLPSFYANICACHLTLEKRSVLRIV